MDYVALSAGIAALATDAIEREEITYPNGFRSYSWRIGINWPQGEFTFEAHGFDQTIWGKTVRSSRQSLSPDERARKSRIGGDIQSDA